MQNTFKVSMCPRHKLKFCGFNFQPHYIRVETPLPLQLCVYCIQCAGSRFTCSSATLCIYSPRNNSPNFIMVSPHCKYTKFLLLISEPEICFSVTHEKSQYSSFLTYFFLLLSTLISPFSFPPLLSHLSSFSLLSPFFYLGAHMFTGR